MKNSYINTNYFQAIKEFFKWKWDNENLGKPKDLNQLEKALPINKNPEFICSDDKIRYTWIGHATAVICVGGGGNIVIDPVF